MPCSGSALSSRGGGGCFVQATPCAGERGDGKHFFSGSEDRRASVAVTARTACAACPKQFAHNMPHANSTPRHARGVARCCLRGALDIMLRATKCSKHARSTPCHVDRHAASPSRQPHANGCTHSLPTICPQRAPHAKSTPYHALALLSARLKPFASSTPHPITSAP